MEFLRLFRKWEHIEEYRARSIIFSEQDPADAVYVILDGEVELKLRGEPLSVEKKGGVIGEMAVLEAAQRSATAKAKTKVTLARLGRDDFERLMSENPDFSLHVMAALANRLRSVDTYITTHIGKKT